MSDTVYLTFAELEALLCAIFERGGLCAPQAGAAARVIAAGQRDGCTSHGIYRTELVLRTLRAGKVAADALPVVHQDDSAVVRVDAQGGFSSRAFEIGLDPLEEAARRLGVATLVVNNCVHFSALWPEVEALAERGLVGLALCPSYATVAPAGGIRPLLGTNPMAFGWPRPGRIPYVFDFATSVAARGEIELYRLAGKRLPEGWAIDAEGRPTTDPEAALAGAMLPFGAHKGSAIATMIELLAGALIGDLTSDQALAALGTTTLAPRHGELILAFDPARLAPASDAGVRGELLLQAIEGQGARLPSQRRYAARAESAMRGIALDAAEYARLERFRAEGLAALG